MNGLSQATKVTIDPLLVENQEIEMLEHLLPAAINQAMAKAKHLHLEAMRDLTGGIDLPGLEQMMQRFSGGDVDSPEKK
jgi:DNA-binding protein YbaB